MGARSLSRRPQLILRMIHSSFPGFSSSRSPEIFWGWVIIDHDKIYLATDQVVFRFSNMPIKINREC